MLVGRNTVHQANEQPEEYDEDVEIERSMVEPDNAIDSDFYRLKLETFPTLQRIYENWLRVEYDPEKKELIRMKGQEPIINERGAMDCMTVLIDIVNKENIQGNLDDDYIRLTSIELANNISNLLFINHARYAVLSPVHCDIIVDDCSTLIFSTLTRALNAGERNSLRPAAEVKETLIQGQQQKKSRNPFSVFGGNNNAN